VETANRMTMAEVPRHHLEVGERFQCYGHNL
jgi:hypothetical protein